jgi:glycine oxidase
MAGARIADVVIAGGGIIGLSLGLELRQRGLSVTVLERGQAMREASWAAGGMLAAHDPENSTELQSLAVYSVEQYPEFLERVEALSGDRIPFRTDRTLLQIARSHTNADGMSEVAALHEIRQWIPGFAYGDSTGGFVWLKEPSVDPRDLCRALPLAFLAAGGVLLEDAAVVRVESRGDAVQVSTDQEEFHATDFVNCCGAWAGAPFLEGIEPGGIPVAPVKGQMVSVAMPAERLRCVLRTPEFYAIPRGDGRVAIGATVERAGFDRTVEEHRVAELIQTSACLLPEIDHALPLQSWAGLRPGTPDGLPILGPAAADHCWHATGHFRDGIMLAPGTARVMAQLLMEKEPDVALEKFSASRFRTSDLACTASVEDSATPKYTEFAGNHLAAR